jgi:hypothetical protein
VGTQDSGELAQRIARGIAASNRTSRTPPGPSDGDLQAGEPTASPRNDPALVEAINQVFALFRLNYHNQFYAAFSDAEQLRQIKKLWLESLRDYPPVQVLQGARLAIESSEYLPTLNRMRGCCDDSVAVLGLPAARDAWQEACNALPPAEDQAWSHAAVYWAGRDCGWTYLATAPESASWPRFEAAYRRRCGEALGSAGLAPVPEAQTRALDSSALPPEEAAQRIRRLREENDL